MKVDGMAMRRRVKKIGDYKDNNVLSIKSMVFLVVLSVVVILGIYSLSYYEIDNLNIISLSDNAYVQINDENEVFGSIEDVLTKQKVKIKDKVTVRMKISRDINVINPSVGMYSCNNPMRIYLNDEEIASKGKDLKYGDIYGTEFFQVKLDEKCGGKELAIVVDILDTSTLNWIYKVYYANSYDLDTYMVRMNVVNIYLSNFLVLFGIICILFNFGGFSKHHDSKRELYISFTAITGAIWIIACGSVATYYGISAKWKYYMEYEGLYIMVFFALKMFYARMHNVKQRKWLKVSEYAVFIYAVIANVLRLLKKVYFQEILIYFHLILMFCIIMYFYTAFKNRKKYLDVFIIYTAIFVGVGIYVVLYNFKLHVIIGDTDIASITIFLLGIYMFITLINEIKGAYMNNFEKEVLLNKAYEDKLTGLNNRRACEKRMKSLDDSLDEYVYIYSFDINGLKELNDNNGHQKGDALIIAFAHILKDVYSDETDFVGRMGGDEFIAISPVIEKGEKKQDKLYTLERKVEDVNLSGSNDFTISFATGWTTCSRTIGDKAWDTYNRADKEMYENKKEMKSKMQALKEMKSNV